MAKKKYYVVWQGHKKGIFTSWNECKKQVDGFENAQYKSFINKEEAAIAFTKNYADYKGKDTKKITLTEQEKKSYGSPIMESISVDAACSGNPGKMEYRGVLTGNKKQLFIQGPYENGTNNVGEFLALVHGLAFLKKKNKESIPIYSDSKTAISWVRKKQCKTNIPIQEKNNELYQLILRAENWLKTNTYNTPILKWETKAWGEIPADFGRK